MANTFSRRRFIGSLLYLTALLFSGILLFRSYRSYRAGLDFSTLIARSRARWRYDDPLDATELRCLQQYIDVLAPDDDSPGALKVGVDQRIIAKSSDDPDYRQTLRQGILRINPLAQNKFGCPFHQLTADQVHEIILISEQAKRYSSERLLFDRLREDTFSYYYVAPESWQSLCYQGPPQPVGFSGYQQPLESCDQS